MSIILNKIKNSVIFKPSTIIEYIVENSMLTNAIEVSRKLYRDNPYHNFTHAILVTRYINLNYEKYNISESELFYVLVAALFHDAGHSGTYALPNSDKFNVFCSEYYCIKYLKSINAPQAGITIARRTINCTQFVKSTFPVDPIFHYQKAIRDADLVSMLEDENYFSLLEGLAKEMKTTVDDSFCNHLTFLSNRKYYSKHAEKIIDTYLERMFNEFELTND